MNELKVKSLGKALEILNSFTDAPCEYGVSELSRKLGITKSTVHNVLSTFAHYGILEYDDKAHTYHVGYKVLELGNVFQKNDVLVSVMKPFMKEILNYTNECVYLAKPLGNKVLYLDALFPETSMGGNVIGVKAPMYCTGIGKAMLSRKDAEFVSQILAAPLEAFTAYTIVDRKALNDDLVLTRQRGFAVDNMEHEFGIKCVAVPLLDSNGGLIGGVSVSGPSLRFPNDVVEDYAKILKSVANSVKKYF